MKTALRVFLRLALFFGVPILASGRLDWVVGWLTLGVLALGGLASWLVLRTKNPDLLKRRKRLGAGTKRWDKVVLAVALPMPVVALAVAGLDVRFGWSAMTPWPLLWFVGTALYVVSLVWITWAMVTNNHFEGTVRVQSDIGHRVVDSGPYGAVRHPGYSGILVFYVGLPLMLGSWWAFIPSVMAMALFVLRTALEDRTLQAELSGYADYARRVRFRLVPGVW
jgi:protein-S-isoprenylcysteine O-methyltransferase Ste14